jgi:phage gp29-like protein
VPAKGGKGSDGSKDASASLASGAAADDNRGFIDGQGYVDKVTESYKGTASDVLAKDLERILGLVDSIESFDELEGKLRELYTDMDPQSLAEMTERFLVVADLAGRAAVRQDAV